jgi:hypothetical protein
MLLLMLLETTGEFPICGHSVRILARDAPLWCISHKKVQYPNHFMYR